MNPQGLRQARLACRLLPLLGDESALALRGGAAINLVLRDLPRLSVDLDFTFVPLMDRASTLAETTSILRRLAVRVRSLGPGLRAQPRPMDGDGHTVTLLVGSSDTQAKVEISPVLRGLLWPAQVRTLSDAAQAEFGYARVSMASPAEVYAGKLVAALDRQHPRDLFDVKLLLDAEGITDETRSAFVVYLAGHNRPMHEVLQPTRADVRSTFEGELLGMTRISVTYEELVDARERAIQILNAQLTNSERRFLLSIKRGEPQWDLMPLADLDRLPALQWKLDNIRRMDPKRRAQAETRLRDVLGV